MLKAVLFDAAGTLIELVESVGESYARAARKQAVELPPWRLDDAFQRVFKRAEPMLFPQAEPAQLAALERDWWRAIVRSTFLAADSTSLPRFHDFEACFDELWGLYSGAAWRERPGARESLQHCRARGWRIGVVSNFDHRLEEVLQSTGFKDDLACIERPGSARAAKPDGRIFGPALAQLGVRAEEVVYVGDEPETDAVAAREAGLAFVDVSGEQSLLSLPAKLDAAAKLAL